MTDAKQISAVIKGATMRKAIHRGKCLGEKFEIQEDYYFHLPGHDKHFSTYHEMKEWLEKYQKAKGRAKKEKVSLPVIDANGHERNITGINCGNGHITYSPSFRGDEHDHSVYPRVDWISAAVAEICGLQKEIDKLENALRFFLVDPGFGHSWRFNPNDYDDRLAALKREYEEKLKEAKATSLHVEKEKPRSLKRKVRV